MDRNRHNYNCNYREKKANDQTFIGLKHSKLSTPKIMICLIKVNTTAFMSKSREKRLGARLVHWEFVGTAAERDEPEKMKVELGKQEWILQFSSPKPTASPL